MKNKTLFLIVSPLIILVCIGITLVVWRRWEEFLWGPIALFLVMALGLYLSYKKIREEEQDIGIEQYIDTCSVQGFSPFQTAIALEKAGWPYNIAKAEIEETLRKPLPPKEIVDYIRNAKKQGFSIKKIKSSLEKKGWPGKMIGQILEEKE